MSVVSSSDGRVSFKLEGYISHRVGNRRDFYLHENEMLIYHKDFKGGLMSFTFPSEDSALKASKELIEQLNK